MNANNSINAREGFHKYYNLLASRILPLIPYSYYHTLIEKIGYSGRTMIDFGCGWGEPVRVLQSIKRRYVVGVDIYDKYLKLLKREKIYDRLILSDITKYKVNKKYDIVLCSHVLEHIKKKEAIKLLDRFESLSAMKVIITVPVGELHQEEYDGNRYQKHVSRWFPDDFVKRGYKVYGFSPRFIFGQNNFYNKFGIFSLVVFALSLLLNTYYINHPEKCVYMLAVKKV